MPPVTIGCGGNISDTVAVIDSFPNVINSTFVKFYKG